MITKACEFNDWSYNPLTNEDERECSLTHYKETRPHTHTYELLGFDNDYEYLQCACHSVKSIAHELETKTNFDGTLTISCKNCDYSKIEEIKEEPEIHNHNFELINYDAEHEYYSCECGEEEIRNHTLTSTTNADASITYTCNTCDYTRTEAHTHDFDLLTWNEENETWACTCGEKYSQNHTLKENINEDGSTTYTCETCSYTKTIYPSHTHTWSSWHSLNDLEEQRDCECGSIETRSHTLNSVEENGYITTTCETCDYTKKEKHTEHDFKVTAWTTEEETLNCICGDEITRAHNIDYENGKTNEDYSTTYECTNEGCGYTLEVSHEHEFTNWYSINDLEEQSDCFCGESKTRKHNLQTTINKDGSTTYSCETCDYSKTVYPTHTHTWSNWHNLNNAKEQRECECGSIETRSHTLNSVEENGYITTTCETCDYTNTTKHSNHEFKISSWNNQEEIWECICGDKETRNHNLTNHRNSDYSTTYECTNDGCGYTKKIDHTHNYGNWYNYTDELERQDCICGNFNTRSHDLITSEENGIITTTCNTCDYEKEEKHQIHEYVFSSSDEEHEIWKCVCGEEEIRNHNLEETFNERDYSYDYKCTNEGCNYTKHIDHVHNYNKFVTYNDDYETWECACGLQEYAYHNFIDGNNKCQNPGCDYEKEEKCEHKNSRTIYENIPNDDIYCYYEITICTNCSTELGRQTKEHNWYIKEEVEDVGREEECVRCQRSRTIYFDESMNFETSSQLNYNKPYTLVRKKEGIF